jgi:hypothetical protein
MVPQGNYYDHSKLHNGLGKTPWLLRTLKGLPSTLEDTIMLIAIMVPQRA